MRQTSFHPDREPEPHAAVRGSALVPAAGGGQTGATDDAALVAQLRRAVQRRTLQYDLSRAFAEADEYANGLKAALHATLSALDWDYAALWRLEPGRVHLRFEEAAYRSSAPLLAFTSDSRQRRFGWGDDLPGRVWAGYRSLWIPSISKEVGLPRATAAARAGLDSAVAFPLFRGQCLWGVIEGFAEQLPEPDGDLLRLFNSVANQVCDFHARHQALHEAGLQRQLFERIFNESPVAIALLDERERIQSVNREFTRLFGYAPDDCAGHDLTELVVPPEDQPAARAASRDLHTGKRVEYEAVRRARDGTDRHVRVVIQSIAFSASRSGICGLFLDQTDRRKAEQAAGLSERSLSVSHALQRAILDAAPYAIILTDASGVIQSLNRAAVRLLGRDPLELVGVRTLDALHQPGELANRASELSAELGRPIQPGMDILVARALSGLPEEREWTYPRTDGSSVLVRVSIAAVRDDSGELTGFLAIARDIGPDHEANEALRRARDAAEAANRAKSDFLATVSHEIRTPMNGILGMSSLLLDTPLQPAQREMLEGVRTSAEALMALINEILDFSRIEARKMEVVSEWFDLDPLIDGVLDTVAPEALRRGLNLVLMVGSRTPRVVRSDPARIRQVLLNLVANAVKFTHEGEVLLAVEASDASVRFSVHDTGIGLSEDEQSRLFQPFSQVDSSSTRRFEGTGLGLAISKRIVELLGGTIGVESGQGAGSTFWFTIPTLLPDSPPPRHPLRVLIAEDHPHTRVGLRNALASLGIIAEVARTEAELVQALSTATPPDVVIIDRILLGPAARNALAAPSPPSAPAVRVLVTGDAAEAPTPDEIGAGMLFLNKPIRRSRLEQLLGVPPPGKPPATRTPQAPGSAGAPNLPCLRVLVVEDNPVNGRLAVLMLDKLGCRAELVGDGEQAVNAVHERGFDLVLMDCHMPVMDGYEACRTIRRQEVENGVTQPVLIIAMTAAAMAGERERCLEAGMDDYLAKPVRMPALRETLRRHFAGDTGRNPQNHAASEGVHAALTVLASEISPEAAIELAEAFLRDTPDRIARLRALAGGADQTTLRRDAHSLKGSAAMVGAHDVEQAALALERSAATRQTAAQPGQCESIDLAFQRARDEIRDALTQLGRPS